MNISEFAGQHPVYYGLISGFLGFVLATLGNLFLTDAYAYIKRKFVKGNKPKVRFTYSVFNNSSHGSKPRVYNFRQDIEIKNIDSETIYDVVIESLDEQGIKVLYQVDHLTPDQGYKFGFNKEVLYKDPGKPHLAYKLLPYNYTKPNLKLYFKNKNGHRFESLANRIEK
jgi:hypothetical protein